MLCRLKDHRLDEASGIAMGLRSPGIMYVQNDSGDRARLFALDARTGRTRAVIDVPGAVNVDWEDIAVARDARGVASIWIADTGDNDARRREVRVYRIDEPAVDPARSGARPRTGRPDVWRLRYPGGPRDVEAMAVAPGGAVRLMSKVILGATEVYAVPRKPDAARVRTVQRIGSFHTAVTGTTGGPSWAGQLTVTGAAESQDGTVLVARTYTDAYLWRVTSGVAAALRIPPVRIALPAQRQGEGITVADGRLVLDGEGRGSAVWSVALPALFAADAKPPIDPRRAVQRAAAAAARRAEHELAGGLDLLIAAMVVVVVVAGLRLRRRPR